VWLHSQRVATYRPPRQIFEQSGLIITQLTSPRGCCPCPHSGLATIWLKELDLSDIISIVSLFCFVFYHIRFCLPGELWALHKIVHCWADQHTFCASRRRCSSLRCWKKRLWVEQPRPISIMACPSLSRALPPRITVLRLTEPIVEKRISTNSLHFAQYNKLKPHPEHCKHCHRTDLRDFLKHVLKCGKVPDVFLWKETVHACVCAVTA